MCRNCGCEVQALDNGSYRNHCPFCLHSIHIDHKPGDRNNKCLGLLRPIGIRNSSKKGMQIIFRCELCQQEKVNIVAEYDSQPDNIDEIVKLM